MDSNLNEERISNIFGNVTINIIQNKKSLYSNTL